jgi:hypothetical protein
VTLSARHDGWTELRQYRFLFALAETGRISVAAREAGMSRQSAYTLREHPRAEAFAAAWDAALTHRDAVRAAEHRNAPARSDRSIAESLRLLKPEKYGGGNFGR